MNPFADTTLSAVAAVVAIAVAAAAAVAAAVAGKDGIRRSHRMRSM